MLRLFVRLLAVKLAVLAGLAGLVVVATRRFDREVAADRRRLLAQPRPSHPPIVTEEMLAGLPEPAQRYLRHAGVVGRPMVDTVRLRQRCRMRPSPGMPPFPLVAEQWYTVEPPGFIWDATVPVEGLPLVRGRDGYLDGRGLMTIRFGSIVPFVDASGPEMDDASLLRHLSEMTWFPSAFLRNRVTWEAIDDAHARVSITDGDRRATGVLEIDAEGRLVAFRAERHAMVGKGFELRPWTAPTYAYGELEGLRLPVRGAAVWTLPDGTELPYIELELTELEYDPPLVG
jgi:hypothetical protein